MSESTAEIGKEEREGILRKVAKLHNHSKNAQQVGNVEEAESYAAMMQKLLMQYKLSMSDVDLESINKTEPIGKGMVDWAAGDVKVRRRRVDWIETLSGIVAKAFGCSILIHERSSYITLVGRESNRKIAEYTLVTLTRAIENISETEYQRKGSKWAREGKHHLYRGYKESFIRGFVMRINERFIAEGKHSEERAIVLVKKDIKEVNDFIAAMNCPKARAISRDVRHNSQGYKDGEEYADKMDLQGKAVEGSDTKRKELK